MSASRPGSSAATKAAPAAVLGATASSSATSTQRRASRIDVEVSISWRTVGLPAGAAGRNHDRAHRRGRHETRTIVTCPAATVLTTDPLRSAWETSTSTVREGAPRTAAEAAAGDDAYVAEHSSGLLGRVVAGTGANPDIDTVAALKIGGRRPGSDGERKLRDAAGPVPRERRIASRVHRRRRRAAHSRSVEAGGQLARRCGTRWRAASSGRCAWARTRSERCTGSPARTSDRTAQ